MAVGGREQTPSLPVSAVSPPEVDQSADIAAVFGNQILSHTVTPAVYNSVVSLPCSLPSYTIKAHPDSQANCTVLNSTRYMINAVPVHSASDSASTASATRAKVTHRFQFRYGIVDKATGNRAVCTTNAICIPTQPVLLLI